MGLEFGQYYTNPYGYAAINQNYGMRSPSTIHVQDTALEQFFERYLFFKTMSVLKFTLPKNWELDYVRQVLFSAGFIGVVNTDKFGVIPQYCTIYGYNVQYQPTTILVTNPLLRNTLNLTIGKNCTLVKLLPDFCGMLDLISFYASQMALTAEAASVNTMNSKISLVFFANNKAEAESWKKAYDKYASGEPAQVVFKQGLKNTDGTPNYEVFTQDVGKNYIVDGIMTNLRQWEQMYLTQIGVPNANTEKKERLIVDEVNSNNTETKLLINMIIDSLNAGFDETNNMFGTNCHVELAFKGGGADDTVNNVNRGAVQLR